MNNINPTIFGEVIGNNPSLNENIDYLEGDKVRSIEEVMQDESLTEEQKKAIISYMQISKLSPTSKNNLLNEMQLV